MLIWHLDVSISICLWTSWQPIIYLCCDFSCFCLSRKTDYYMAGALNWNTFLHLLSKGIEGHRSLMHMLISVVQIDTKYSDCCYWKCGFCLSVYNFTFTSFVCSKQSVWTYVYLYVQKPPKQSHSSQSCSPSYAKDQKKKKKKKTLQLLLNNKRQGFNV